MKVLPEATKAFDKHIDLEVVNIWGIEKPLIFPHRISSKA